MKRKNTSWPKVALIALGVVVLVLSTSLPDHISQAQPGGTLLTYGSSAQGSLSTAAPTSVYSFNGIGGDLVEVAVIPLTADLQPFVTLAGPDGQPLITGQPDLATGHSPSATLAHVLPQAGMYLLTVSGLNNTTGDFVLRLEGRGAAAATTLQPDTPLPVTLMPNAASQNAVPQFFTFTALDCPTSLTVTNQAPGEPFTGPFAVIVRDETGQVIAGLLGGDAREDRVTVAALSGRYEVEVRSDDPSVAGLITLLVTCASQAPGCAAAGPALTSAGGLTCPPCPTCGGDLPGGSIPACPIMNLTWIPDPPGVRLTWNPVPGVDYYWIHMYGMRDGDEVYLGAAGVPASETEFLLGHLFDGFWGMRFVIEAIQGETAICSDETPIYFQEVGGFCENFTLTGTVTSHSERTATWTWDAYPGADGYVVELSFVLPDSSEVLWDVAAHEAATTTVNTTHPPALASSDTWHMRVQVADHGDLICAADATIVFEELPNQQLLPVCENFSVVLETMPTDTTATVGWTPYPGAEGYWVYVLDEHGMMVPGFPTLLPPDQLTLTLTLGPGTYTVGVGPWISPDGAICLTGFPLEMAQPTPCAIRTDRGDVPVHVGPGRHRSVFSLLPAGVDILVTGQAVDEDGNLWWQIDKTQIPGHEAVISLWVAASDVAASGNCENVPPAEPSTFIPGVEQPEPGGWGPCGSCDTCGHSGECVTSPDGQCLWDPATCRPGEPGGGEPGPSGCLSINASIDMSNCPFTSGSAMIDTVPNCEGSFYTPGTSISAHAVAVDPKCMIDYWSGCGASGSGDSVSFSATSSCTVTAHMRQ